VLITPYFVREVVHYDTDPSQRLLLVLLNLDGRLIGLGNHYASNDSRECATSYHWFGNELPNTPRLISRDYNMVEYKGDKGVLPPYVQGRGKNT